MPARPTLSVPPIEVITVMPSVATTVMDDELMSQYQPIVDNVESKKMVVSQAAVKLAVDRLEALLPDISSSSFGHTEVDTILKRLQHALEHSRRL
jgi:hypothetical protein